MATSILLGTQGWLHRDWVGRFYATDTPAGDLLREYARQFRAVEVESTFHGTPRPETIKIWYTQTPPDFRFACKFPQTATRDPRLKGAERDTAHFLATMQLLGDKLGPLLMQYPYEYTPERQEAIGRFFAALPHDFRYAIQVRHRGWLNDAFYSLLADNRVALALSDRPTMANSERVTTDFAYIRWIGDRSSGTVDKSQETNRDRTHDLDRWTILVTRLAADGVAVWGFANNRYQGHSPETVRALMERLNLPQAVPIRVDGTRAVERRAAPRVDATYRIAYECFNSWGVKVDEGPAKTVDISGRGALIEIQRGVPLDASMVLLVMAPFHMLMVKGSVVHSRRTPTGAFHVGVHLTEVVEGTWDVLNWVIRERISEKAEWSR